MDRVNQTALSHVMKMGGVSQLNTTTEKRKLELYLQDNGYAIHKKLIVRIASLAGYLLIECTHHTAQHGLTA